MVKISGYGGAEIHFFSYPVKPQRLGLKKPSRPFHFANSGSQFPEIFRSNDLRETFSEPVTDNLTRING
jgi:hypothetical protein